MPCFGPLTAYRSAEVGPLGRRALVFDKRRAFSGVPIKLPCGKCPGCKMESARQWTMRIMHEVKLHNQSCFLTLTYSNEHLPPVGTLVKRDLQLFLKRVRKWREVPGLRYFACGEYGDINKRPHYHAIFCNQDFPDKRKFSENTRGDPRFTSQILSELWPFGHSELGEVNFDSAGYVARYVLKKQTGSSAYVDDFYTVYDADGVCHRRLTEFTCMSLKPGLGSGYFAKYGNEVAVHDNVVVNGRLVRPPKYYDTQIDNRDFDMRRPFELRKIDVIKRRRRKLAVMHKADSSLRRLRVKEVILLARSKKRSL